MHVSNAPHRAFEQGSQLWPRWPQQFHRTFVPDTPSNGLLPTYLPSRTQYLPTSPKCPAALQGFTDNNVVGLRLTWPTQFWLICTRRVLSSFNSIFTGHVSHTGQLVAMRTPPCFGRMLHDCRDTFVARTLALPQTCHQRIANLFFGGGRG